MYLLPFVFSYLIGTISPGFFITKFYKHVDIRKLGAKYTGAANVYRIAGFLPAILTGTIDFAKGVIAISLSFLFWEYVTPKQYHSYFLLITALFTIIGHIFPFYLNFKGGRGAATSYGVLLVSLIMLVYAGYPLYPILWLVFYTLILFFILHSFSFSGFVIDIAALVIFFLFFLKTNVYKESLMVSPTIVFYILETSLAVIILSSIYTYTRRKSLGIRFRNVADPLLKQRISFYIYILTVSLIPLIKEQIIIYSLFGVSVISILSFIITKKIQEKDSKLLQKSLYFTIASIVICVFLNYKYALITQLSFSVGYIAADLINRYTGVIHLFNKKHSIESIVAFFAFTLLSAISINIVLHTPISVLVIASVISPIFFFLWEHQSEFFLSPLLFLLTLILV